MQFYRIFCIFLLLILSYDLIEKNLQEKFAINPRRSPQPLVLQPGPSWEPFPSNLCGPGRGETWRGSTFGGSSNFTVIIPLANPSLPESYGNAVTCGRGFRLHAFRAVRNSPPTPTPFRNVVLARGEDNSQQKADYDVTGYSIQNTDWLNGMAYFDIDTFSEGRFSHWVSESAVFIEYWSDLSAMHPGQLRLVLTNKQKYKLELLSLLGLTSSEIVWGGLPPEAELPNSIVYFPPYLSQNDQGRPDLLLWSTLWSNLMDWIRFAVGSETNPPFTPSGGLVIMPRSRSGNNQINDRIIAALDWMVDHVDKNNSFVLQVDDVNFSTQVREVARAKSIVCNYGSAFFVNAGIARNATIFTIDNEAIGLEQIRDFPAIKMFYDYIRSKNRGTYHHYALSIPDGSYNVLQHAQLAAQ
jgi:hypothetical protein